MTLRWIAERLNMGTAVRWRTGCEIQKGDENM
jgi:hypothetical protein